MSESLITLLDARKQAKSELKDILFGVTKQSTRNVTLHGYIMSALEMLGDEASADVADSYLLHARFECLGRGSLELRERSKDD